MTSKKRAQNPGHVRPSDQRVTRTHLLHGWAAPARHRLRLAQPGDGAAVGALFALAEVELESELLRTVGAAAMGEGLRRGVEFGSNAMLHSVGQLAFTSGPQKVLIGQATILVAVDSKGDLRGALGMLPPGQVLAQFADNGIAYQHILIAMLAISKISALAVRPESRGIGLATALLARGVQLYQQAGYHLIYGTFHDRLRLAPFYEGLGFTVLPLNRGLPLEDLLGISVGIQPGPGERLFLRWS